MDNTPDGFYGYVAYCDRCMSNHLQAEFCLCIQCQICERTFAPWDLDRFDVCNECGEKEEEKLNEQDTHAD